MGEYAKVRATGARVKVGTCEDMYYLRADQAGEVCESDTDFRRLDVLEVVRFRFPFPDEDAIAPGMFEDPFRGLKLWGFEQPADVEHGSVQFSASNGYLTSLPCPEGPDVPEGLTIHRNGYGGPASLIQQGWRRDAGGRYRLVGIVRCNGCHTPYRLEDGHQDAAAVIIRKQGDEQIAMAEKHGTEGNREVGDYLHAIADRLLAGYEARTSVPALS